MTPAAVLSLLVKTEGVSQAQTQLRTLDKTAKKTGGGFAALGRTAKSLGPLIGAAGAAGAFKAMNDEYREAQKTGAQTNAVLKSTGSAAKVTKKHIENLAGAISRKSGIDDEAIQQSENMLLTFTKVRNETGKGNKIFDRATQVVTDMSVALGQSGKSSAIQLGKALNDPVKGVTALQRVGVSFTASQKETIKGLVAHGKTLDAQKLILRELGKEFGGSAAAQATAGDKLKVSLGNLAEAAGGVLVPALDKAAVFVTKLIDDFTKGQGIAKFIIPVFNSIKTAAETAFPAIRNAVQSAITFVAGFLREHQDDIAAVGHAFENIGKAAKWAFENVLLPVVRAVFPVVKQIISGALTAIGGIIDTFSGLLTGDFRRAWDGVKAIFSGVGKALAALLRAGLSLVLAAGKALAQAFINGVKAAPGLLLDAGKWMVGRVLAGVKALPGVVADAGKLLAKGLIAAFKAALNLAHEIAQAVRDLLPKVPGYAFGIGKALVQGIVNGIKSVPGLIGGALKGIVGGAGRALGIGEGIGRSIGREALPSAAGAGNLRGANRALAPFAAVGARFGLSVSSGRRPGAITSSGNVSYHSSGEAVDLAGPPAGMMSTFRFLKSHYGSRLAELIYTPGGAGIKNGQSFTYGGKVAADHYDHVHVAFDTGRPGVGDGVGRAGRAGRFMGDGIGDVAALAKRAGFKGNALINAIAVAGAESGFRAGASNRNTNGSIDRGYWQINSVHGGLSTFDPMGNARAAYKISGGGRNWRPWVTYNTGAYRRFLGQARAAAAARIAARGGGRSGGGGGAAATKQAAKTTEKVSPFDMATAQADLAIAQSQSAKAFTTGGAGGRVISPALQQAQALANKGAVVQGRINTLRKALGQKGHSKAARLRWTQELSGLLGTRGDIQSQIQALQTQTTDTGATAADVTSGGTVLGNFVQELQAQARAGELTDAQAKFLIDYRRQQALRGELGQLSNMERLDILGDIREELAANTAAQEEANQRAADEAAAREAHTQALNDLRDEVKRQTDFATSVSNTSNFQLTKSLADMLSGQIVGYGLAGRAMTPGRGVEYAY